MVSGKFFLRAPIFPESPLPWLQKDHRWSRTVRYTVQSLYLSPRATKQREHADMSKSAKYEYTFEYYTR